MIKIKEYVFVVFFIVSTSLVWGQSLCVKGVVKDEDGKPIPDAHISIGGRGVTSDAQGRYDVCGLPRKTFKVLVTHVSYEPFRQWRSVGKNDSVIVWNFALKPGVTRLKGVEVLSEKGPEEVFHSPLYFVIDFEVLPERLLLLTFRKNAKKDSRLTLTDSNDKILYEQLLPGEAKSFKKDFRGNYFVDTKAGLFVVSLEEEKFELKKVERDWYKAQLAPCIDSINHQIILSDFQWFIPRFNYYSFDTRDSSYEKVREVVDIITNKMYRWEYYNLPSIHAKREADEIARYIPNMDNKDVGALMTGFHNSIYYDPVYAPLFVSRDSIFILDHYSDQLFKYNRYMTCVDSIKITYHRPAKTNSWKNKVYFDKKNNDFYGLYLRKGHSYLGLINTENGGTDQLYKLAKPYPERIKVVDQYAYYLYQPANSPERHFLYRELLSP